MSYRPDMPRGIRTTVVLATACLTVTLAGCDRTGPASLTGGSGAEVCGPAGQDGNVTLLAALVGNTGSADLNVIDVVADSATGATVAGWYFWTRSSDDNPGAADYWRPPHERGTLFTPGTRKELEIRLHRTGRATGHIRRIRIDYRQGEQRGSLSFHTALGATPGGPCSDME